MPDLNSIPEISPLKDISPQHKRLIFFGILIFAVIFCSWRLIGCSDGGPLPGQVSSDKILEGAVKRSKPMLTMLEGMKPEERQAAADQPRMASTLKTASADPGTAKELADLGVKVK